MLSGIGPVKELEQHGIPIVLDLPEIGKNLQDHCFATATLLQKPGTNDRMSFETILAAVAAARAQHKKDKSGLMTTLYCSTPMGWFKNDAVYATAEYKALDAHQKEHLKKLSIPIFEITTVTHLGHDLILTEADSNTLAHTSSFYWRL